MGVGLTLGVTGQIAGREIYVSYDTFRGSVVGMYNIGDG